MLALLVEDDEVVAGIVREALELEGFEVDWTTLGAEAMRLCRSRPPDIIILDLILPDMDGCRVCEGLRAIADGPLLILSSRSETVDKVLGLELGADDYMTKPFDPLELRSRIKALLRRGRPVNHKPEELLGGGLKLDLRQRLVFYGSISIPLTRTEFELLRILIDAEGQTVSRGSLLRALWGDGEDTPSSRTVDSHMVNLRRKLQEAQVARELIAPVRGVGYRFLGSRD